MAILAGLVIALLTLSSGLGAIGPYILAFLLVLTGLGLRIEATIEESRG